ncbi:MAG TPA: site-specific integrase [Polyangiaceae bacterium]|jgi:integrase|nr:site-specific integrase [Polyangiaceae bacterium]
MAVNKRKSRDGTSRLVIDIPYRTADGRNERYRRDAQLQTKSGAEAEHRRLVAKLKNTGTLAHLSEPSESEAQASRYTFKDAVKHFRATRMVTLKPSTRASYENRLTALLVPRFGESELSGLTGEMLVALDAELARDGLKPGTRQKVHIVFRSVLRSAVDAGFLASMPKLPRIPQGGRKMVRPFHRDDLDAILAVASPQARLAFALAAFAGLRAGEVRGLRWSDIDLKSSTLAVRRSLTCGEETTPKSGDQRVIPLFGTPLLGLLESANANRERSKPWATVALTVHGKPWGESGLNQAFKRAVQRAERAGLGLTFHDLRHFFVTELFRRGASAPVVRCLAGHAELSTTQRYADMTASDLRGAILLLGNGAATGRSEQVETTEKPAET